MRQATLGEINVLTERIIGCAYKVGGVLGSGYLEKVYENALTHECRKAGLQVEQQRQLIVSYDGVEVGHFVADMVIGELVLIEIKAVRTIDPQHEAQCINYLATTGIPVCLLMNFGPRVEIRRFAGRSLPRE